MKIIFLDVDGVLNRTAICHGLESDKITLLKSIVDATGCEIVLSSTWRKTGHQRKRIELMCRQHLGKELLDATPVFDLKIGQLWAASPRWKEIQHWLNRQVGIQSFVILDDEHDMGQLQMHLVKTDSFTGLTAEITQEVINRLK